jgi:tetratricopeptide (TPR) repeat protein
MIARDEERNLPLSLGPLAGLFDEAVVLDTGSRDATMEVARSYGARVFEAPWGDDFSLARNLALSHATTDWVLWLDADNALAPEDFLALRGTLAGIRGKNALMCEELVLPQGDRLWQKRVFPRLPGFRFEGRIHEQLACPKGTGLVFTDVSITHWGYRDPAEARRKGERNLRLLLSDPLTKAGDFYLLYQTGRTLLNLRRHREALGFLRRAAAADTANLSLWSHAVILAADVEAKTGDNEGALRDLAALAGLRPDYGPARYFLGRLLYRLGRMGAAAPELERALALGLSEPGWGSAPGRLGFTCASKLGRALLSLGDPEGALAAFRRAATLDPGSPEPRVAMAELALSAGRLGEAMGHVERALELAPFHRRAHDLFEELAGGLPPGGSRGLLPRPPKDLRDPAAKGPGGGLADGRP